MIWTTAGTNRVCSRCLALKDTVVGYTDELGVLLPPLHPRCRCAIMYDEVGTPRAMQPKPKPQPQPVPKPRATSGESAQGLANLLVPNPNPLPLKSIGIRHYATIQVILANAPNPKAAAVWSKFEDKIRIGDTSRKGTAVHFNGAIYFSIDEIKNGNIINEPYQIFFHEGSHNIDYALAKNGQNFSEYYGNEGLLNALEKDLAGLVPNIVKLKSKWIQKYTLRERAILSGLLDLYSNGKHNLGTGHNREYWLQGGRARKSREVFAMFMEASIANATAYEILNRYLPTAVKTFDAMLEELLK